MKLTVYFDGSYGPRFPYGTAAYGYVVKIDDEVVYKGYGRTGSGIGYSCNCGEYDGLYHAMKHVKENYPNERATFYGDSTLVINQMNGVAAAKKGLYLPYYQKTKEFSLEYVLSGQWAFEWVPRALNSEADKMSQYQRFRA